MKLPALPSETTLVIAAAAVAAIALWWMTRKGVAAQVGYAVGGATANAALGVVGGVNDALGIPRTQDVVNAVADPNNLVYTGVNDAGAVLSGNQNFSLGASIYNLFHPGV